MTKFDDNKLKLRRAFSLEGIEEEDSWVASGDEDDYKDVEYDEHEPPRRRYSYPLTPRTMAMAPNPEFNTTILEIRQASS
jgi:hypothetical protein